MKQITAQSRNLIVNVKPGVHTIKERFEWLGVRITFVCKREAQLQEQEEHVYLSQRDVPLNDGNTKRCC